MPSSGNESKTEAAGWRISPDELVQRDEARELSLHESPKGPPVKLSAVSGPLVIGCVAVLLGAVVGRYVLFGSGPIGVALVFWFAVACGLIAFGIAIGVRFLVRRVS